MEQTTFFRKGFLYSLYLIIFQGNSLPEDTCSYRGRLMISAAFTLATLPVTIIRIIWDRVLAPIINDDLKFAPGFPGQVLCACFMWLCTILGFFVLEEGLDLWYLHKLSIASLIGVGYIMLIVGFITTIVGVALIFAVIWVLIKFFTWAFRHIPKLRYKERPNNQAEVLYKSLKDKYCKKISWKW